MFQIDRPIDVFLDELHTRFIRCRPRVLVVTDGALSAGGGPFGLSHFIDVIGATSVHGMTPEVVARDRNEGGTDGAFDDLTIGRFDALFLFGIRGETSALTNPAWTRIARFMEAGGGVFATGDHEDLGAGMSGALPRVRAMRFWASTETPDVRDNTRLTTNLPGSDRRYEFADQADAHPQRLYANFAVGSDVPVLAPPVPTSARNPHPLVRMSDGSALDVYPDHPHEGECRLPDDLTTTFDLDGEARAEWPGNGPFVAFGPRPRAVAYTMSAGNGFDGSGGPKTAVTPRSFISIAAYNGHVAGVGRVVTDATWHHYVNINLDGMRPGEVPNPDMRRIERFWSNLVTWLMPRRVRICLWPWRVLDIVFRHPIAEEIRLPDPDDVRGLEELGALVAVALDDGPGSVGSDIVADALALVTNPPGADDDARYDPASATSIGHALLGATVVDIADHLDDVEPDEERFDGVVRERAERIGVQIADRRRAELEDLLDRASRTERVFRTPICAAP